MRINASDNLSGWPRIIVVLKAMHALFQLVKEAMKGSELPPSCPSRNDMLATEKNMAD